MSLSASIAVVVVLSSSLGITASFDRAGTGLKSEASRLTYPSPVSIAASFTEAGTGLKSEASPLTYRITIDKATFADTPAGIKVGDIVEWINNDIFDHTTTAKTGAWDVVIPAGKKVRVTMKKTGTFDYFCKFHPNMTGTLTVKK